MLKIICKRQRKRKAKQLRDFEFNTIRSLLVCTTLLLTIFLFPSLVITRARAQWETEADVADCGGYACSYKLYCTGATTANHLWSDGESRCSQAGGIGWYFGTPATPSAVAACDAQRGLKVTDIWVGASSAGAAPKNYLQHTWRYGRNKGKSITFAGAQWAVGQPSNYGGKEFWAAIRKTPNDRFNDE